MKNILVPYISYNHWANQQLVKSLLKLKPEQAEASWGGVQPSVFELVAQLWAFEHGWYERLQLVEKVSDPARDFKGTFEELCSHCLEQSALLEQWVIKATPVRLEHTIAYTLKKNEHYKTAVYDVIIEVVNGSTLLRGQLISLLQQLNIKKLPVLDYRSYKPRK